MSLSSWLVKAANLQVTIPCGTSEQCIKRIIRNTTDSHSRSPTDKNSVLYIDYICLVWAIRSSACPVLTMRGYESRSTRPDTGRMFVFFLFT